LITGRGIGILFFMNETHVVCYPVTPDIFSDGEGGQSIKLTTHLHLEPRLRMFELNLYISLHLHGVILRLKVLLILVSNGLKLA
jgi:hypothetical protein